MATWNSVTKMVFKLERFLPGNYGYGRYLDVDYSWEYNTTSDSLTIRETDEHSSTTTHFGNYEAEAQLKVLANWYATYEGKEKLKNLLKEELSGED